ncbi:hypothetical protein SODALDRAFT_321657 [Sodiomyces alkalinus F11]|uniref:CID domain-containing protein n=1 Tax=Sodiomyces alkalinus (strain CBS 110278 / VKM F-3762 / F11) TaxID=1314773 RepID=A0A3N2Q0I8_SODAK|nr:hypothetical protein SODALDRAFT_321657 [Sodiomyces alkalinus F11]ROT40277.1 hypothetical protein SODALDRAFT_321657 [Sodiomyces alkalinus F11]
MSDDQPDLDVAEDYRQALEDLSSTNRADISTLTTIARENTEHAQVITDVLQKHILRTAPHKKLPALYVLDSIVKNVGTPYTLFFGAQLYQTFMEAYAAVDNQVRRKMEETLQTWKQPVPQSLDDRPVFPPEVTRPIEESLLKARTSALAIQAQGRQGFPLGRGRGHAPVRATPTPPGMRPGSAQHGLPGPPLQRQQQMNGLNGLNGSRPPSAPVVPHTSSLYPPTHSYGTPSPFPPPAGPPVSHYSAAVDIASLNRDIEELISVSKVEVSENPNDQGVQQRLKGLLDLQTLLQTQNVPPDQLVLVKNQVADLAVKLRPYLAQKPAHGGPVAAAAAAAPHVPYKTPLAVSSAASVVPPSSTGPAPQQGSLTLDALLGKGALASLLSRQSVTPQVPTPPPAAATQQPAAAVGAIPIRPPQPHPQPSAAPTPDPMALLAGLRKAGLLSGVPTSTPPAATPLVGAAAPPPPFPGTAGPPPGMLPPNLAQLLAPLNAGAIAISLPGRLMNSIQLDAASLKQEFRPHLIPALFEALGPQCTQCGRRFRKDEAGRKKKTAHMDWHFQVHQRLAEAERRGQHRSWYVDVADWLKSREVVDAEHKDEALGEDGRDSSAAQKKEAEPRYVVVPDASAGVNSVCPICQEKFENKWLDTAQEWVWLDTMLVGNRAYHVSCHAEATRPRDGTPARSTPEPALGKRKAEVEQDELKNLRKVKMDAA